MGIPFLSGRAFIDADVSGAPVAVVTEETARRYWPNQSAIGKHIRLLDDKDWRTIVGVIPNVRAYDLQRNAPDWIGGYGFLSYKPTTTPHDPAIPPSQAHSLPHPSDRPPIREQRRRPLADV